MALPERVKRCTTHHACDCHAYIRECAMQLVAAVGDVCDVRRWEDWPLEAVRDLAELFGWEPPEERDDV